MDSQAIGTVLGDSIILTIVAFRLYCRVVGSAGRPGGAAMAAFVLGWLSALMALLTGAFPLRVAVGR